MKLKLGKTTWKFNHKRNGLSFYWCNESWELPEHILLEMGAVEVKEDECECHSGGIHCGLCVKPYACEPGMKHIYPSIEHPKKEDECDCLCHKAMISIDECICNGCTEIKDELPINTLTKEQRAEAVERMTKIIEKNNKMLDELVIPEKIKEPNYPIGDLDEESKNLITTANFKKWVCEVTDNQNQIIDCLSVIKGKLS